MADKERLCSNGEQGGVGAFQARMTAQRTAIEQYHLHAIEDEGRELSLEEAAEEWIKEFAGSFADNYDAR